MRKWVYSRKATIKSELTHPNSLMKGEEKVVTSGDVAKTFNQIQHPFMIKLLSSLRKESLLNLIKVINTKIKQTYS